MNVIRISKCVAALGNLPEMVPPLFDVVLALAFHELACPIGKVKIGYRTNRGSIKPGEEDVNQNRR